METLYHFTSLFHWARMEMLQNCLVPTGSLYPINLLWLTSSPIPEGMGLDGMLEEFDKRNIRITVRKRAYMYEWNIWCIARRADENLKEALIVSAGAEDTHKTWYVSEREVPFKDILLVENIKTGEVLYKKQ